MDPENFENKYGDPFDYPEEEEAQTQEDRGDNCLREYSVVELGEEPTSDKWTLPPLYRPGALGRDLYHQIGFDGEYIVTLSSIVGGKMKIARNRVELNTRSKSLSQQAMIRARNLYTNAVRENYRQKGSNLPKIKEPMLGHPFKNSLTCRIPLTFPVGMEFKMDGVRGMFELEPNGEVSCRSRGGIYYNQYGNICDAMKGFFEYLPTDTMLDAELYVHGVALPDISGASRKKTSPQNDGLASQIKAHIFDARLPDDLYYEERKEFIRKMFDLFISDNNIKEKDLPFALLPYKEGNNMDEVMEYYNLAIREGYEGIIVKRMAKGVNENSVGKGSSKVIENKIKQALEYAKYRGNSSHSHNFYKLKPNDDEEGIVLNVLDCKGREEGCARFEVIDPRGNIFTIRPQGDFDERRELFNMGKELIGKLYTYTCIGFTKYGVPNHPTGKCVREDFDTEKVVMERRKLYAEKGICICNRLGEECICVNLKETETPKKKKKFRVS